MPRDIPEEIDRDRLRFLVSDESLGSILVYEYEGSASEGRFAPRKMYIKSGLYTVLTEKGKTKHVTELFNPVEFKRICWETNGLVNPVTREEMQTMIK